MLKIQDVTIENLKTGKLKSQLPEFYELKKVVENNEWHINDPVFSHTLTVLDKLQLILKKLNKNSRINSYLNRKVNKYNKKQLLSLAIVFHDIAKPETITYDEMATECYGHEKVGSEKVKNILKRFDISPEERDIVVNLVKNHGEIHSILSPTNKSLRQQFNNFRIKNKTIYFELILMAMADTMGSQLKKKLPDEYKFRIHFYNRILI